jgi:polar amino acid transport system permease protein
MTRNRHRSSPLSTWAPRLNEGWALARLLLLGAVLVWLAVQGSEHLGYNWQWYRVPRYLATVKDGHLHAGPLLEGLLVTLRITGVGLVLALVFGLVTAVARLSRSWTAQLLARGYLELIRNTPLLIQLFFIYFVLAPILGLERFTAAVLALSLFEGAYASEIMRAGILAVPRGQWEAASSLGLGSLSTYRHVVLPQALRLVLPPLTSQAVSLVKNSALVSTIAIYDLTMHGEAIIAETFLTFEIWFTVAAIYLLLTVALATLASRLEQRLKLAD